jgi:hypothetical protein
VCKTLRCLVEVQCICSCLSRNVAASRHTRPSQSESRRHPASPYIPHYLFTVYQKTSIDKPQSFSCNNGQQCGNIRSQSSRRCSLSGRDRLRRICDIPHAHQRSVEVRSLSPSSPADVALSAEMDLRLHVVRGTALPAACLACLSFTSLAYHLADSSWMLT